VNRSKWKPFYDYNNYNKHAYNISHFVRRCVVFKQHIGLQIPIHTGIDNLRQIKIKRQMVGNKYGQLALTKAKVKHQIKKKKAK